MTEIANARKEEVVKIINDEVMQMTFTNEVPDRKSMLKSDLAIDSLRIVELITELEMKLNVELDLADLDPQRLNTLEDIYELFSNCCR